jgi:hypothetical protein
MFFYLWGSVNLSGEYLREPRMAELLYLDGFNICIKAHKRRETKHVLITILQHEIFPSQELCGIINISYPGRFDSVVINSQIENSSDIFNFTFINGKKISCPYARLSIWKDDLGNRKDLEFIAITKHFPLGDYSNAKFRATIIQEHKEIASDIAYIKILKQIKT